jgi:ADP-heptose:LPS heptosyltransferase
VVSDPAQSPNGVEPRFYTGENLSRPRIAILFCDSLGDFAVATVVADALRRRFPGSTLDYYGGPRTSQLEEASSLIDSRYDLFGGVGLPRVCSIGAQRRAYDLVVNMEASDVAALAATHLWPLFVVGKCYSRDLRRVRLPAAEGIDGLHYENWTDPTLTARYPDLTTSHISEIWCRLSRVAPHTLRPILPSSPPPVAVPDVLIATGATRPAKIWPLDAWRLFLRQIKDVVTIGLIGADPVDQWRIYHCGALEEALLAEFAVTDLRGRLSLPEVVGALGSARACVTVDNGVMHLSAGTSTPTVAIFGGSAAEVWAAPLANLHVIVPPTEGSCSLCRENRFRNAECLIKEHRCMQSVTPAVVASKVMTCIFGATG